MTNLQTNVPLITVPFVDQGGNITEPWFLFLVQIFRRTGGTGGGSEATLTLADVLSLEDTFAPLQVSDTGTPLTAEVTLARAQPDPSQLMDVILAPIVAAGGAGSVADQTFTAGTDFTPGTTTTLTLGNSFANAAQIWVFFDPLFQGDDQYSLSGTTLTFTSAIPVGVNKVYVKGMR